VIGKDDRPATAAELDQMRQLVAQAMEQGALGVSTSLQYVPDRFARSLEMPSQIRAITPEIKSTTSKSAVIPPGRNWCISPNPPRFRMANGRPRCTIQSQQGSVRRTST